MYDAPLGAANSVQKFTEQEIQLLLDCVMEGDAPIFTDSHIEKLIVERKQLAEQSLKKIDRQSFDMKFFFVATLLFITTFSALVLWQQPDVFPEVASLLIGMIGGSAGGYGIGKRV